MRSSSYIKKRLRKVSGLEEDRQTVEYFCETLKGWDIKLNGILQVYTSWEIKVWLMSIKFETSWSNLLTWKLRWNKLGNKFIKEGQRSC